MNPKFERHTNVKGVLNIQVSEITYECNAIIQNYNDLLEVGNTFKIGGYDLVLVQAKYNPENHGVYYVFKKTKEAF